MDFLGKHSFLSFPIVSHLFPFCTCPKIKNMVLFRSSPITRKGRLLDKTKIISSNYRFYPASSILTVLRYELKPREYLLFEWLLRFLVKCLKYSDYNGLTSTKCASQFTYKLLTSHYDDRPNLEMVLVKLINYRQREPFDF